MAKTGRPQDKLNTQQEKFVLEYLKDLNGTQAAIRAGYSAESANEYGYRLLQKKSVLDAVSNAMADQAKRTRLSATWIVKRLIREAVGKGPDTTAASRVKALELLAKHIGMLKEKIELTGRDGGPIETLSMSDEERLERINLLILSVRAKQAEIAQQPAIEGTATEAKEGENANG